MKTSLHFKFMTQRDASEILNRLGARQLSRDGTEFELQDGVVLRLTYEGNTLAAAQVRLTKFYKPTHLQACLSNKEIKTIPACCMSKPEYDKFLTMIERLSPIGSFESSDPIGVINPSGWITRSDKYSHSNIVRVQRSTSDENSPLYCEISRFTVFYWLLLQGKVKSKRFEKNDLLGPELTQYFVTVDRTEIRISEADYLRLHKGQVVKLQRMIDGSQSKLITIQD